MSNEKFPCYGVMASLPSGGEVFLLLDTDTNLAMVESDLDVGFLGQRACANAGLYDNPRDHPIGEDVWSIINCAAVFRDLVRGKKLYPGPNTSFITRGSTIYDRKHAKTSTWDTGEIGFW